MRFAAVFILLSVAAFSADWREQAILDLTKTPHARLHPVPVRAVTLQPGFWKARQDVTIQRSIPTLLELLEEHGVVTTSGASPPPNYARAAARSTRIPISNGLRAPPGPTPSPTPLKPPSTPRRCSPRRSPPLSQYLSR